MWRCNKECLEAFIFILSTRKVELLYLRSIENSYIFPTDEWLKFEEKLSKLPVSKKETRKLVRFFLSSAYEAELDKQGRVLLQQDHRGFADIAGDVVLAGVGSKIEIWSKEKWEESALYGDNDEVGQDMDDFDIEF